MSTQELIFTDTPSLETAARVFRVKHPTSLDVEEYPVTTLGRLADASMVGDLVAWKLKYNLSYKAIREPDLQQIRKGIKSMPRFFFYLHMPQPDGTHQVVQVYPGALKFPLLRAGANAENWVWENVTISLIEK